MGQAVLVSDWKEQETIPQSWCQTGDQFFANARMECSIFGAQLIEHAANSRHDRPVLLRNYFVVISSIIDHTTLRTCQLLRLVLSKKQSPKPWTHLHLISDCGPHYRSMEALAHGLVTLCQELSIPTSVHFGCEKHFKSCIDRLFGWFRGCLQRHLDRKKDILTIDDLFQALKYLKSGFVENQEKSGGTKVHCIFDESPVPTESLVLSSPVATRTKIIQPCFLYTPLQNRIRLFLPAGMRAHSMAPRILRRWPENLGEAPAAAWPTGGD